MEVHFYGGQVDYGCRADEATKLDAAGDYMCIHASGQTHILRGTMKELEDILDPRLFQRVHRSTIVNLDSIKELLPFFGGQAVVILKNGDRLTVSRNSSQKLQYLMGADS